MATIWDAAARAELARRAASLTPAHTARWGRFSVAAMVAHLNDATLMALRIEVVREHDIEAGHLEILEFVEHERGRGIGSASGRSRGEHVTQDEAGKHANGEHGWAHHGGPMGMGTIADPRSPESHRGQINPPENSSRTIE